MKMKFVEVEMRSMYIENKITMKFIKVKIKSIEVRIKVKIKFTYEAKKGYLIK